MLVKEIEYTDYNDVKRKEKFYFNLTQAEVIELEMSDIGGISKTIEKIVAEKDNAKIISMFKTFIAKAYGEKSEDGRQFRKSPEILQGFMQTEAYSALFMELGTDAEAGAAFFQGILPKTPNLPPKSE